MRILDAVLAAICTAGKRQSDFPTLLCFAVCGRYRAQCMLP